jgi:hypothetical protein
MLKLTTVPWQLCRWPSDSRPGLGIPPADFSQQSLFRRVLRAQVPERALRPTAAPGSRGPGTELLVVPGNVDALEGSFRRLLSEMEFLQESLAKLRPLGTPGPRRTPGGLRGSLAAASAARAAPILLEDARVDTVDLPAILVSWARIEETHRGLLVLFLLAAVRALCDPHWRARGGSRVLEDLATYRRGRGFRPPFSENRIPRLRWWSLRGAVGAGVELLLLLAACAVAVLVSNDSADGVTYLVGGALRPARMATVVRVA